jgi:hypothetical protein
MPAAALQVRETAAAYKEVVEPYINALPPARVEWIYNILDKQVLHATTCWSVICTAACEVPSPVKYTPTHLTVTCAVAQASSQAQQSNGCTLPLTEATLKQPASCVVTTAAGQGTSASQADCSLLRSWIMSPGPHGNPSAFSMVLVCSPPRPWLPSRLRTDSPSAH